MQSRFIVIGAGMAGASAAAFLAEHGPTTILEAEDHPGYHTTGRSAASYIDTYGHPMVCAATRASRRFLSAHQILSYVPPYKLVTKRSSWFDIHSLVL